MISRLTTLAAICGMAVSASAQRPTDIVAEAAHAVVVQDGKALEAMRFTARGFDFKPISVAALLAHIEGCTKIAEHKRGTVSMAHEIHYDCPQKPQPPIECSSDVLVVAIDRASSPDVNAFLQYHPLETPECQPPQVPVPGR